MKKLKTWSKSGVHPQHVWNVVKHVVFGVLMLIIMPLKIFSQTSMIVGKTDAVCVNTDGEIKVQLLTGTPNFYIMLTKAGSASQLTQGPVGLGSYVFSNLEAGDYTVTVVDGNSQSVMQGIVVEDDANWPLAFYTSEEGRSNGVDVKNANNEDVIAAGIFLGELQIDQANNSQLFNSNGLKNIYAVHFSKCGYIKWEKQIGNGTADCFVKAINLDPVTQDVYICGDLIGGIIYFEGMNGSILAIANTSSQYREGFLARLDAATGNCLWVSRIANGPNSARDIHAEGICVDENGLAYVFGDFLASNVVFYNSSNQPSTVTLSNLGIGADNYLVVYDDLGNPLTSENSILSGNLNDEAGAVDCYMDDPIAGITSLIITGSKDNTFLGQLWEYSPGSNNLASITELSLGTGFWYFGKSVETLPTSASQRHVYISGWKNLSNGGTFPFLARWDMSNTNGTVIPFSQNYSFVGNTPSNQNKSTDIDINLTNGDAYFIGLMNVPGFHPYPNGIQIPASPGTANNDLFIDKFSTTQGALSIVPITNAWSDSHNCTFGFFNDLPAFAISSDNDGMAYMTGGFSGNQLSFPLNQGVPVIGGGNTTAYMARVWENNGGAWIKKEVISEVEENKPGISLFPNPTRDELEIELLNLSSKNGRIRILSIDGIVQTETILEDSNQSKIRMKLSGLAPGIYLMEFKQEGLLLRSKFTKL
jgi:hypothetical protein